MVTVSPDRALADDVQRSLETCDPEPAGHLAAALDLLDAHGPADTGLGLTVRAVAAGTGLSRSTIRRHWECAADMNRDLALWAATSAGSWQERILRADPSAPLAASIRWALDDDLAPAGTFARTAMAGWPSDDPARRSVVRWQRAQLEAFERWLGAHLVAHGRHPHHATLRVIALATAALVEGHELISDVWQLPARTRTQPGHASCVAETADAVVESLTRLGRVEPGAATAPTHPSGTGFPRTAKWRLVEEATRGYLAAAPADPAARQASRLVDMDRLARVVGVSRRQVFATWPAREDFNAAVVQALADRTMAMLQTITDRTVAAGLDGAPAASLIVETIQGFLSATAAPDRASAFDCTLALLDDPVADALVAGMDALGTHLRNSSMAMLFFIGQQRRPDLCVGRWLDAMRWVTCGMQRLTTLDPRLLEERTIVRGRATWAAASAMDRALLAALTGS